MRRPGGDKREGRVAAAIRDDIRTVESLSFAGGLEAIGNGRQDHLDRGTRSQGMEPRDQEKRDTEFSSELKAVALSRPQ